MLCLLSTFGVWSHKRAI